MRRWSSRSMSAETTGTCSKPLSIIDNDTEHLATSPRSGRSRHSPSPLTPQPNLSTERLCTATIGSGMKSKLFSTSGEANGWFFKSISNRDPFSPHQPTNSPSARGPEDVEVIMRMGYPTSVDPHETPVGKRGEQLQQRG
ncbi:hypothetical protein CMUS01_10838 [Colletotrichum musicola]|uniref:Uncharacterized protein n=1 Tax=Colletotrichum musicola TaxID=2175873 RepID=A0A8H6K189_9PEZI|nr:hypothetical protein CMUS01_10838 [Colletotrichum musicola]